MPLSCLQWETLELTFEMIAKTEDLVLRPALDGMGGGSAVLSKARDGLDEAVKGLYGLLFFFAIAGGISW